MGIASESLEELASRALDDAISSLNMVNRWEVERSKSIERAKVRIDAAVELLQSIKQLGEEVGEDVTQKYKTAIAAQRDTVG